MVDKDKDTFNQDLEIGFTTEFDAALEIQDRKWYTATDLLELYKTCDYCECDILYGDNNYLLRLKDNTVRYVCLPCSKRLGIHW